MKGEILKEFDKEIGIKIVDGKKIIDIDKYDQTREFISKSLDKYSKWMLEEVIPKDSKQKAIRLPEYVNGYNNGFNNCIKQIRDNKKHYEL